MVLTTALGGAVRSSDRMSFRVLPGAATGKVYRRHILKQNFLQQLVGSERQVQILSGGYATRSIESHGLTAALARDSRC
jgi:hypothetical protein